MLLNMDRENKPKFRPNSNLKLMDQVREVLRYHHYAYRTEQTYCQWILRYINYFGGNDAIRSSAPSCRHGRVSPP